MRSLTPEELSAVLAGLRCLQRHLEAGTLPRGVYDILTDEGTHDVPDSEWIDDLCRSLNCGD
jgi:hypothetical protein